MSSLTRARKPSASTTSSAPASRAAASLSGVDTTATVRAPQALASCSAAIPMPPLAPCTSTVSPGGEPAAAPEGEVHREVVEGDPGPDVEPDLVGQRQHVAGPRDDDVLPAAHPGEHRDALPGRQARPGRGGAHHAGHLAARREGRLRAQLVLPAGQQQVRPGDPGVLHVDDDGVGRGLGLGDVDDLEGVGAVEADDVDSAHGGPPRGDGT